jgi:hypothetical protein
MSFSRVTIDIESFKPVSFAYSEMALSPSSKCDEGRRSRKGVAEMAGHQRRQRASTRWWFITAMSDHRRRYA